MAMKNAMKIFLLVMLIFLFSCEDKIVIVKCDDCMTDEPVKTDLRIKLESRNTLITVYEGNIEDSIVYARKNYYGSNTTMQVTLNKKYTVTAIYETQGAQYIAIDAATPEVRYEKNKCDDPCYFIYDRDIDLRLKY